ncbi:MAG: hypothetical protein CL912_27870 [Deltaproteobacteria bacterium]|nr:hypothetical protein [Deltaproteobacteria bacterium]
MKLRWQRREISLQFHGTYKNASAEPEMSAIITVDTYSRRIYSMRSHDPHMEATMNGLAEAPSRRNHSKHSKTAARLQKQNIGCETRSISLDSNQRG